MDFRDCLLVRILRDPVGAGELSLAEWDLLIRQARRADLLARLHVRFGKSALLDAVPQQALHHMTAARRVADKHARIVAWEIGQIRDAIADGDIPIVLLKGAAYIAAGLPPAAGRLFSDIDIMVPRPLLGRVEQRLVMHGWVSGKLNAYDQMYYRRWMHELPPLTHRRRETVLDVHHNILPLTSQYCVDPAPLFASSRAADAIPGVRVLSPEDMVLHSAAHLFCDGEFDHALRDLADLDDLLDHFGRDAGFLPGVHARARSLGLERPLHYALEYRARMFGKSKGIDSAQAGGDRPGRLLAGLMNALFERSILPNHPSCDRPLTRLARGALYLRGHYLRMPWYLLIPHLLRKSWRSGDG